jgi:hypothetical protein
MVVIAHHDSTHPAQPADDAPMSWLAVLLAAFVVLGLRRPGRMGSTHVTILVASALALVWAFTGLGR